MSIYKFSRERGEVLEMICDECGEDCDNMVKHMMIHSPSDEDNEDEY